LPLIAALALAVLQAPAAQPLDNDYVRVTRNAAPCADAHPGCGARVVVALAPIDLLAGGVHRTLARGDIAVFQANEPYAATAGGAFVEVSLKPTHPKVQTPPVLIPPEKNALLYDGDTFFVFEERLPVGETRARHSHSQRVVVVINDTKLQQWPDGQPEVFRTETADDVRFNGPITHIVKTIGDKPLRNIVIEFKP
jgi:hypothetical protein